MADVVYTLCALTSLACAALLWRSYRQNRVRLLLWSGLCFSGLALNNILLLIDANIGPETDLSIVRAIPSLLGVGFLLYGLVWDSR